MRIDFARDDGARVLSFRIYLGIYIFLAWNSSTEIWLFVFSHTEISACAKQQKNWRFVLASCFHSDCMCDDTILFHHHQKDSAFSDLSGVFFFWKRFSSHILHRYQERQSKKKSLQMKKKGYYVSVSRDTFLLHNYFSLTVVLPLRVDILWLRMVTSRLRVKWST